VEILGGVPHNYPVRKKLLVLLSVILSLSLINAPSNAAVKAGAKCTKAGATSVSAGKKYTCVKSGTKLVWNKGVTVKAAPKPDVNPVIKPVEPTPTPSPTPTPTPTPKNLAGDPCSSVGQRESNSNGYLECREVANNVKKFFQLSLNPKAPPVNISPESLDICRIPDQSTTDRSEGPAIAYPIPSGKQFARIPRVGAINALIIPIDFPDSPGSGSPRDLYNELTTKANEWMKWYSNGKSYYKFQTYDKWIRAPKNSTEYVPSDHVSSKPPFPENYKTGRQITGLEIASEYLDLAQSHFDYKNMHNVFILYPRDVKNIWTGIWKLGIDDKVRGWKTTNDPRLVDVWVTATGARDTYYNFPLWAFFLHENLHNQGLQGHAPNQGYNLGIMTNQYGLSLPLSSWDTLIIDWQLENQFYCLQKENVKPSNIVLSPLEREELGTKAIMIKLSKSQVLVIESRRRDKWSSGHNGYPGLPEGFYGVVVYKVDTTAKPLYGVEEPDGKDWKDSSPAYAYYIRNLDVSHGTISGAPQSGPIDMNFFLYEGESLTTNGIKISLIKSGDHDEVKIEKVG
jgi:hypothetical protein